MNPETNDSQATGIFSGFFDFITESTNSGPCPV
jgi:hypothetical protein